MRARLLILASSSFLAAGCAATSRSASTSASAPRPRLAVQDADQPGPAEQDGDSLAAAARDPTASLTAFQIRFDHTSSFHELDDASQTSLVLQPIIPFKLGEQRHIARVTVPYVINSPDWGALAMASAAGLPPNYVPTEEQTGLADTTLVDLLIFDAPWQGRWGVGAGAVVPTASDPALGAEKWAIGPALVGIAMAGDLQYGTLLQWLVSFAGDDDRDNINSLAIQPFASYGLSDGWSVGTSEITFNYDFEAGGWTSVPFGGRVEKLIHIGSMAARVFVDVEYNFRDNDVAPEWTWRLAFVPLLLSTQFVHVTGTGVNVPALV